MNKTTLVILVLVALLCAPMAFAANTLAVTGGAAHEGSFGMEANHDGSSTNVVYVQDNSPTDESAYTAKFLFAMNSLVFASGGDLDGVALFRGDGAGQNWIKCYMKQGTANPVVKLVCLTLTDAGWVKLSGVNINPAVPTTEIQVEFQAATTAVSNDGVFNLYKQGVLARTNTTLDNNPANIDQAYIGMPMNVNGSATGGYTFDSFESFR